jgi:GWxTD domain-containing protein
MKFFTPIAFVISILCSTTLAAKKIGMDISYAQFMDDAGQAYVEIYYSLASASVDFKQNAKGMYTGGVEILVQIKKDSATIAAEKFRIMSPEYADTVGIEGSYVNQTRFPLPNGEYDIVMDIQDVNEAEEVYQLEQGLTIDIAGTAPKTSDLVMLDSYSKADESSIFSKSGYDLVPLVNSGSHYFTESTEKISFYTEIYNTQKHLGENEPLLIKYYIKERDKAGPIPGMASFTKKESGAVLPVLTGFNISTLPSGNYTIVVEALDKNGQAFVNQSMDFYRKNSIAPISMEDIENLEYQGSFVDRMGGIDSLYKYTQYLYPISSEAERRYQKEILAEQDLVKIKRYFFAFWSQRSRLDPEKEWLAYYEDVKTANQLYTSRLRKGYMTDRGRVFLTYGPPDAVDRRQFEPGLPPYEMWQYNVIATPYVINQTNKFFVFAEFSRSTNEYQMLHSNAVGELNNRRWKYQLSRGAYGTGGDIDQNDLNSGDDFGSRLNNNLIIQGSQNNR